VKWASIGAFIRLSDLTKDSLFPKRSFPRRAKKHFREPKKAAMRHFRRCTSCSFCLESASRGSRLRDQLESRG
jgi:hypothetical protein